MRHKRLILVLVLLIISIAYIIRPYMADRDRCIDTYKENIIRFHVRANSDREEDQLLKLKVRDSILKETRAQFSGSRSIEDTRRIVKDNLDNIKSIAQEAVDEEGMDIPVEVSFGQRDFPTRKYGNITLPSGEYETLQVSIGEGEGKNWWCVMFPPLCFVDMGYNNIGNSGEELGQSLKEADVDFLLSNKEPPIVLRSKIMEIIKRTRMYFAENIADRR